MSRSHRLTTRDYESEGQTSGIVDYDYEQDYDYDLLAGMPGLGVCGLHPQNYTKKLFS
jgi:hypothetical protein